jgi:hypothetical protein
MTRLALCATLCVLLAACSGSAQPADVTAVTETTDTKEAATTTTASPTSPSEPESSARDLQIDSVALHPAGEGGPHPTLSWDPVTDAATYWLFLRDGSGVIYWAWSGADTSVRVGGGSSTDLNQTAALHEEMSWSVFAFDDTGTLLALSDVAEVSP